MCDIGVLILGSQLRGASPLRRRPPQRRPQQLSSPQFPWGSSQRGRCSRVGTCRPGGQRQWRLACATWTCRLGRCWGVQEACSRLSRWSKSLASRRISGRNANGNLRINQNLHWDFLLNTHISSTKEEYHCEEELEDVPGKVDPEYWILLVF